MLLWPGINLVKIRLTSSYAKACTHMLYSHPTINDDVLVTGDGDFTTVIQDLKTHDKHVICMGIDEQCSVVLKNCCDEFISLIVKKSPGEKARPS
jgi:uncharacterized LabA/DUF88 family protein